MKRTQNDFYTVDAHCDSVRLFSEKNYSLPVTILLAT